MDNIDDATKTSDAKARGTRLRYLRESVFDKKRSELSNLISINHETLKSWELGKWGGLTAEGARRVIKYAIENGHFITLDWLYYGKGELFSESVTTRLIGNEELIKTLGFDSKVWNELLLFRQRGDCLELIVTDSSMYPYYKPGDIVVGQVGQSSDCEGKDCIIILKNGEKIFRRVRRVLSAIEIEVLSLNAVDSSITKYILETVSIDVMAPVSMIRRKT